MGSTWASILRMLNKHDGLQAHKNTQIEKHGPLTSGAVHDQTLPPFLTSHVLKPCCCFPFLLFC